MKVSKAYDKGNFSTCQWEWVSSTEAYITITNRKEKTKGSFKVRISGDKIDKILEDNEVIKRSLE